MLPKGTISHKVLRKKKKKIYHLSDNEMFIRVIHAVLSLLCLRSPLGPDPKQTEIILIPLFASVGFGAAPEAVQQ